MIVQKVVDHYNLQDKVTADCWMYCEIRSVIYGLNEAGKLDTIKLQTVLTKDSYKPYPFTQGLYTHAIQDITFWLGVDGFGVKYTNKADVDHLITCLTKVTPSL